MTAPIRVTRDTQKFELYRIVSDYEALQDGFLDRIDDLDTTMSALPGFADGVVQKLLAKNPGKSRDTHVANGQRAFGWKSLGDMLERTGLALVLVVDDERFAPMKTELIKRRRKNLPTHAGKIHPKWRFTSKTGRKARERWWNGLTDAQKKKHQRKAQRGMVASRKRKRQGALISAAALTASTHAKAATSQCQVVLNQAETR